MNVFELKKLKVLTREKIFLNLNFYYLICKKNTWKLPKSLGDDLFHNFLYDNHHLGEEDNLKFFTKEITSISKIEFCREIWKFPNFFKEIDKESLENIDDCLLYLSDNSDEIMINLLTECRHIQEIRIGDSYKDYSLFNLLENSKSTLKFVQLTHVIELDYFANLLKKFPNLQTIKIKNSREDSPSISTSNDTLNVCNFFRNSIENLKELSIHGLVLQDYSNLMETLNRCINLERIKLNYIKSMAPTVTGFFYKFRNRNNRIKSIDLSHNDFYLRLNILEAFQTFSLKFPQIQELILDSNSCSVLTVIDDDDEEEEEEEQDHLDIPEMNNLQTISLNSCEIDEKNFKYLGKILNITPNLQNVSLSHLRFFGNSKISNMFSVSFNGNLFKLNTISLKRCSLDEEDSLNLSRVLKECLFIEQLNLDSNRSMANGLNKILKSLEKSKLTLRKLSLNNCNLDEVHGVNLGNLLSLCSKIEKVSVNDNKRLDKGVISIIQGLERHKQSLQHFNIAVCSKNEEVKQKLKDFLSEFRLRSWRVIRLMLTSNCKIFYYNSSNDSMVLTVGPSGEYLFLLK